MGRRRRRPGGQHQRGRGTSARDGGTSHASASGGKDEFGRTHWEQPLAPPYAAVSVRPALFHTQGGLRVDEHARVLSKTGQPITGLYASGGAASGISGHGSGGYLAGNGLLPAFGLAFLAAEHLAGHQHEQQEGILG